MKAIPYLGFDGRCREAFEFYARCFDGRIESMLTHGDAPIRDEVPAEWHPKIMNAHLVAGDLELMGADSPPGQHAHPQGLFVAVILDDDATAERVFEQLSQGGTISMPMAETFWASRFGMVTDRFGIPWAVNGPQRAF
jgi:PhnB protein